jgi:hypothetical protein
VLRDRAALDNEKTKSKIYLGACLVLPYFTFEQNVPQEEKARLFVKADDFPLATSAALHYYLTKHLAYDEMYLLGDSGGEVVGKFGAGAAGQKNRAHYVELGAALAALDFYGLGEPGPNREKQYFITARNGDVTWEGLPSSRDNHRVGEIQAAIRYRLTAAAIFFYSVATYGSETIAALAGAGSMPPPPWFVDHFKRKAGEERLDPRSAGQQEPIRRFAAFGERFLLWLRDINADPGVSLLKMGALLDENGAALHWRSAPVGQIVGNGASRLGFDKFVSDCLNDEQLPGMNAGTVAADRYLNLFSLAADRFTQRHLNVPRSQAEG